MAKPRLHGLAVGGGTAARRAVHRALVRTSWPGQLRLLYHAFPGVLEDVQLRFDYEVQTDAATKRIMLARLPSLLRAFVHVGALLGDVPPAEALGLAEHLVACTSDGASTTVSVGSFTTLNAYLASRRVSSIPHRGWPENH